MAGSPLHSKKRELENKSTIRENTEFGNDIGVETLTELCYLNLHIHVVKSFNGTWQKNVYNL